MSTPCTTTCDAAPQAGRTVSKGAAPAFIRLASLGVARASGKDARSFLHGQFTNRLDPLGGRAPLAGYCTPKGRLLSIFRVFESEGDLHLIVPKSIAPGFIKRLSMFVLRADVKFQCALGTASLLGAVGPDAETALSAALSAHDKKLPQVDHAVSVPGLTVMRVADAATVNGFTTEAHRYLVYTTEADRFAPDEDEGAWWATEIAAGLPTLTPETLDRFVPQSVNLELVDGVVFNKGCYPGQEVVSRIQHIGTPSRRMYLGLADGTALPRAGDGVYAEKGGAYSLSGDTVSAVGNGEKTLFLFSLPVADAEKPLALDAAGERKVTILPLPYEFRNMLH